VGLSYEVGPINKLAVIQKAESHTKQGFEKNI